MPLIFSVQQAIEGVLWLTLPDAAPGVLSNMLVLSFLVVAQLIWPIYAPFAAWSAEPDRRRRRAMLLCLGLGVVVSASFLPGLITGPHRASVVNRCIVYQTNETHPETTGLIYLAATCLPLLLSSRRVIAALGGVVLAGSIAAYLFYWQAFISVWCFFGAAASAIILAHFEHARRNLPQLAAAS